MENRSKVGVNPIASVLKKMLEYGSNLSTTYPAPMLPIDAIRRLYRLNPGMSFEQDLTAHFERGYVVSTPQAFGMARPVRRDWTPGRIGNPWDVEPLESADCWFLWVLSGDLAVAARWLPCELPWLGFARRGKAARFVPASALLNKALAFSK